jgi:long-subunit acyl-CoA synthetase (AMP-forming)
MGFFSPEIHVYSCMVKRLFDIVSDRNTEDPGSVMLAAKEQGSWHTYSSREVWQTAEKLAGGLCALGVRNMVLEAEHQEKIAIISPNRPEWIMADLGVQLSGAVLTPVYPTVRRIYASFFSQGRIYMIALKMHSGECLLYSSFIHLIKSAG